MTNDGPDRDDFYVGYLPMPPRLKGFVRAIAIVVIVAVVVGVAATAANQSRFPTGWFEFGVSRDFEGVLYETPIPTLRVRDESAAGGARHFLLVGFGKFGLPEFARGAHGQRVRFRGSLIYRENMTMVEMNEPESFEVLGDPGPEDARHAADSLGRMTVTGELVDTKCYLGVMKPATGKVHRACAIRCLSGGVPPGVLVRRDGDDGIVFMLAGANGRPLEYDVEWAALTVRATGELELHDGLPVLRVESLELVSDEVS